VLQLTQRGGRPRWESRLETALRSTNVTPHPTPPPAPPLCQECPGPATTELADLREDPGDRRRRKQVSQPMPPSQGRVAPVPRLQRHDTYRNELHRREAGPRRVRRGRLHRPAALRYSDFTRNFSIFTMIGLPRKPLIRRWWRPQDTRTRSGGCQRGT
jgi:hypothetical protein